MCRDRRDDKYQAEEDRAAQRVQKIYHLRIRNRQKADNMNINDVDITQKQLPSSYLNHEIFLEIKSLCESYESLSFRSSSFIQGGTSAILGIDHIIFTSLKGTLASIGLVLKEGYINDGYSIFFKTVFSNQSVNG